MEQRAYDQVETSGSCNRQLEDKVETISTIHSIDYAPLDLRIRKDLVMIDSENNNNNVVESISNNGIIENSASNAKGAQKFAVPIVVDESGFKFANPYLEMYRRIDLNGDQVLHNLVDLPVLSIKCDTSDKKNNFGTIQTDVCSDDDSSDYRTASTPGSMEYQLAIQNETDLKQGLSGSTSASLEYQTADTLLENCEKIISYRESIKNLEIVWSNDEDIFSDFVDDETNSEELWSQEMHIPCTQVLIKNELKPKKLSEKVVDPQRNSEELWSQEMHIPSTQVLIDNKLKPIFSTTKPSKPTTNANSTRKPIKWIKCSVIYHMSQEIYDAIVDKSNGKFVHNLYLYRKDSIAKEIDLLFKGCVIYLEKPYHAVNYRRLTGYCAHKECRKYRLTCDYDNPLEYKIEYSQLKVNHVKPITRQTRRYERDEMKKDLKVSFPNTLREQLIRAADDETIILGNYQDVKSTDVFRKMRSEVIQEQDNCKNDILDIEHMMTDDDKTNFIQKILSRKNFAVYIHSKIQHQVLHQLHLKREEDGTEVTGRLDATGNIARDIEGVVGMLLYYALTVNLTIADDVKTTPLPMTEQFNCRHKSKHISEWLYNFKESHNEFYENLKGALFDWMVSDFSYANFHGILHAFNNINLDKYLNLTFEWLQNKMEDKFPNSYYAMVKIRMCFTHLMHTFADMVKRYYGKMKNNKQSFEGRILLEILASMIQSTDLAKIQKLWQQMCILLKNEYINDDVENAVDEVMQITSSGVDEFDDDENNDKVVDIDALPEYDKTLYQSNMFYIQFANILEETETNFYNDEKVKNKYFKPEFLDKFVKRFIPLLPLWSCVLVTTSQNYVTSNAAPISERINQLQLAKTVREQIKSIQEEDSCEYIDATIKPKKQPQPTNTVREQIKSNSIQEEDSCEYIDATIKPKKQPQPTKTVYEKMKSNSIQEVDSCEDIKDIGTNDATIKPKNEHHNQYIENYFGIIKQTILQQSATLGAPPIKIGRVITLSRKKTESTVKSFNLCIPKVRLNSQLPRKKPEKAKTKKSRVTNVKKMTESGDSTIPISNDSSVDPSTFTNAKENFNKSKPRVPFTYFQQRAMKKATKKLQSDSGKTLDVDTPAQTTKRTIKLPARYRD